MAYRWLLANSLTGEILSELPLSNVTYTHTLNEPGTFKGTLPLKLSDPLAGILEHDLYFSADPALDIHALYAERDGVIVWGGLLWADRADYDAESGTLQLSGEGWHSWLRGRVLTDTLTYVQVDQASIAADLIGWVQEEVFGGSAGIDLSQVQPTGRLRDRTYHAYERKQIGVAIEELGAVIDGFAFHYEHELVDGKVVTRFLVDYPPSRTTSLVFTLDEQVIKASVDTDRSQLATRVHGIGAGEGDLAIRSSVTDEGLILGRLWLDAVDSHTDVTERTTLEDYGAERLKRGSRPIVVPKLTVRADRHPMVDSYRLGDIVGAVGRSGWHRFTGSYRITEISVSVDDNGTEAVDLSLAPEGVFNPAGAQVDRPIELPSIPSGEAWGELTVETDESILFFDDFTEFHATNRGLDPAKWFIHDHGPQVNQEKQEYRPSAVRVSDGRLIITATEGGESGAGDYTSGLVTTAGRFSFLYGTVEMQFRLPGGDGIGKGFWPSLFSLEDGSAPWFGPTSDADPGWPGGSQLPPGWPTTGKSEVDLMEYGHDRHGPFSYHAARHWGETANNPQPGRSTDLTDEIANTINLREEFAVAGLTWTPTYLAWTFNGVEFFRLGEGAPPGTPTTEIPTFPLFLILNFAVGGVFDGDPNAQTQFPAEYQIDWIRVRPLADSRPIHLELVDAFDPPDDVWTAVGEGGQLVTADGAVTVACADNFPGMRTTTGDYSLISSWAFVEVSEVPAEGNGSTQAWLTLTFNHAEGSTPQGEIRIGYSGGDLVGQYQLNGAYTTVFSVPYNPTAMRYWALAAAGGEIGFSYADDGSSWIHPAGSTIDTTDVGFPITSLDVELTCGFFEAEVDPGQARFEGLNIIGFVPPDTPDGEKPDATNTGLTNAGALTAAGFDRVTQGGQVIEDLEFDVGYVEVQASNVTFRNCRFVGPSGREALVRLQSGQTGLLFEDCEVDGQGDGTGVALAYGNYIARRVYIHDVVDGVKLGDNTTLEACFITDLATGPGTHNDGAQSSGGNNIVVRGCTIENQHGQTSAILIGADLSDIDNVLIEGNWLSGGGFTLYAGSDPGFNLTNCVIRDNVMTSGEFGFTSFTESEEIDFVDNVDQNGDPLPDRHFP